MNRSPRPEDQRERARRQPSQLRPHPSEGKRRLFENIQNRIRRGHRRHIARKREAHEDVVEYLHDVTSSDDAAYRVAVAHGLSERGEIGQHTEHLLGAPKTEMKSGADLIEDQNRAVLVRNFLHAAR